MRTLTYSYDDASTARSNIEALVDAGIARDDISLIGNSQGSGWTSGMTGAGSGDATGMGLGVGRGSGTDSVGGDRTGVGYGGRDSTSRMSGSDAGSTAAEGAGVGGVLGGAAGLLAGLGMMAIPGLGPLVAAGWLASTAAGAVAGAAAGGVAGGVVGAMTESGVLEEEAHRHAENLRRGGTIVSARVPDDRVSLASSILSRGAVDLESRSSGWRDEGWTGYDPDAPFYGSRDIDSERERLRRM